MAASEVAVELGAGWEEEQCTTALAQLEQLQAHINHLRLAIPRVIEPFSSPPNAGTYKLYAQGVLGSQNDIKALQEQWRNPETQNIFEHTKKSLSANADLSASASIPSHGWTEREKRERESKKSNGNESTDEGSTFLSDEEIALVVADFHKTYPNIKLDLQDENHTISARFVSGSVILKIRVVIERDADGRHKLNVECLGTAEPWLSINRCLVSRPKPNDLKYLLDMIAAYKTIKGTSCAKCGRLLDDWTLTPTARRSKQVAATNETPEIVWEAYHENCLG